MKAKSAKSARPPGPAKPGRRPSQAEERQRLNAALARRGYVTLTARARNSASYRQHEAEASKRDLQ